MSYMCTSRIKSKQTSYQKVRLDVFWGKCVVWSFEILLIHFSAGCCLKKVKVVFLAKVKPYYANYKIMIQSALCQYKTRMRRTHVILSIDKVNKAIQIFGDEKFKIFGDEKSVDLMVDDGPLHYGFSYHFQGTIFVFKLIIWLQFSSTIFETFFTW